MSIPVDLAALGEALARHDLAYLLTSGDARPHVGQVFPRLVDGVLVVAEPGRTARAAVGRRPQMTLLLPPRDPGDHTLLVDGDASLGEGGELRLTPTHAVLHRAGPARTSDPSATSDCGNDCRPIGPTG